MYLVTRGIIAFTDGISEAMNADQDEWGEDRLMDTVKACLILPPAEIISCIMKSADSFAAGAKQNDDMTIIVLSTQALGSCPSLLTTASSN